MGSVRLMNRVDMKYVTTRALLYQLLEMVKEDYYIQEIDGKRIAHYYTMYFDTDDMSMFSRHQFDKRPRQKLRVRSYEDSDTHFLEIKTKDNHGRTSKKRIALTEFVPGTPAAEASEMHHDDFLGKYLTYNPKSLHSQLENRFQRITLVNKGKTERITIDMDLRFHNFATDEKTTLDELVIIELKRDGRKPSPIVPILRQLRIKPKGFSKYCMGCAMTDHSLRINRFKPKLHYVEKMQANL